MQDMKNHLAFNRTIEDLDVAVVDDSKFQQQITRAMLQPLRLKRLRFYDTAKEAFTNIRHDPPHLLLMDWRLEDMPGRKLITALRHQKLGLAAFVPVFVTMANPTRSEAEEAFRCGAQAVIAKPFSLSLLQRRLQWVVKDARPLKLSGQHFVIDGVNTILSEKTEVKRDTQEYKTISDEELFQKSKGEKAAAA